MSTVTNGYIYAIEDSAGKYKIGKSVNPLRRLKQLQTGNENKLRLAYTLPVLDMKRAERNIHTMLSRCRTTGEWFVLKEDDKEMFLLIFDPSVATPQQHMRLANLGLR